MVLSRRRLLLVVLCACLLVGAFAGLHADGHDHAVDACCLGGLVCAVAVAVVLLARIVAPRRAAHRVLQAFARYEDPSRHRTVVPSALCLAALCRLRV
jgi:hypothetical protein